MHEWRNTVGLFTLGQVSDLGLGQDLLYGGGGVDLLTYRGTTRAAVVNLSAGTVLRGTELDRFVQVEGLVLGEGNAALTGMRAGTADNPGGGDVTVLGLANGAVIDGGAGLDVLDLRGETTGWVINQIRDPSSGGGDVRGFEVVLGALGVSNSLQGAGAVMAAAVMTS